MPANAKKLLDLFEQEIKPARSHWDHTNQEIADLVLPTRDFLRTLEPGERRNIQIYDETAPNAAPSLASAVFGLLINPLIRWMGLGTENVDERHDEDAEAWFYDTSTQIINWFNNNASKSPTSSFEVLLDLSVFGGAVELVREKPDRITFQARDLSNFYMAENDEGDIIHEFREFKMTPQDVVSTFSEPGDQVSAKIKRTADRTTHKDDEVTIIHAVYQRDDRDPFRMDGPNKPWASIYIEADTKKIIRESGFDLNPFLTPRWSKAPEEVYGRGPADQVLPGIKGANAIAMTLLQAGELAVNPPIISFDNLKEGILRTTPGARIYLRGGSRDVPQPLNSGANPQIGEFMLQRQQAKIEEAFFLDRFKLPGADETRGHPRMTATEVIERRQEGLLMASPILSRLYAEWLDPRVTRVYSWLFRTGRLLPLPASLEGRAFKIHYISPMALSQRASQTQAFAAAFNLVTPLLAGDPEAIDNFDVDETIQGIYRMFNGPPQFMRSPQAVIARRRAREQAVAQAQQLEQLATGAKAARDVAAGIKDVSGAAAA